MEGLMGQWVSNGFSGSNGFNGFNGSNGGQWCNGLMGWDSSKPSKKRTFAA